MNESKKKNTPMSIFAVLACGDSGPLLVFADDTGVYSPLGFSPPVYCEMIISIRCAVNK